ncbi:hypothetical protein [Streptomyces sp. F001]|uniref:hypothetical protein n=1 Tax=Streptomyces sp. F001 TaxID=1510026 RepID=UPI0023EA5E48|nr:hypothetical protein [Streptomyces sp. F001]
MWHVDRLTRSPRELEDVIDLADRQGVELATVSGEIDRSRLRSASSPPHPRSPGRPAPLARNSGGRRRPGGPQASPGLRPAGSSAGAHPSVPPPR